MSDESIMPWGKHQGKQMADVPAEYLIWLYDNQKCSGKVKIYIVQNLDVIRNQAKANERKKPPQFDF